MLRGIIMWEIMRVKFLQYSRLLFCVCFFLLCAAPLLLLEKIDVSTQENRKLTTLLSFLENNKFNEQYENYLKDQFPWRFELIKFYYYLQYSLMSRIENERAFVGDNGWMFSFHSTRERTNSDEKSAADYAIERAKEFFFYYYILVISIPKNS